MRLVLETFDYADGRSRGEVVFRRLEYITEGK